MNHIRIMYIYKNKSLQRNKSGSQLIQEKHYIIDPDMSSFYANFAATISLE